MDLFSVTSLIIFVSSIGFGLSLYAGDRHSIKNRKWFLFSCLIGLWSLGLFGVTWSDNPSSALIWQYLLDVSAIFIPVTYFSFASELVGLKNKLWRTISYILATCLVVFSFSPYFKIGMTIQYDSFYWIKPGPLYFVFPSFFLFYIIVCLIIYIRAYAKSDNKIFKAQMRNMLLASVVGFGGGITNFLPQVLNVYPFGNYLTLLYLFFMSYGVLKYKFISKKIISAQLLVGAIVLIFLFNLLQTLQPGGTATVQNILIGVTLLILVSVFGVLIVRGVYREVEQREKIEILATNLEKANARLQELDKQKSEFVSFATHQLRAPLTAMKGYASLLIDGDMGKLTEEAKVGVGRIYESSSTLANIVDDYLNISRIELGTMKYTFDTINLKDMVENVIAELKPNIEKSKLAFSFKAENDKADYRIWADKDKLKQVIANLIDNSVKYTPSGSVKVTLSLDKARHKIIFALRDTGIGIDPQVLPLLFQKFTRADNANKVNIKGTGLGLYVAKEIVTAHKGTIRVESAGEGKGSTFIVELEATARA